ncbi:ATPase [Paenibacillus sp. 1011MAR3C5]|uniref:N-acetylglucosamine kinase n=1 Tax=Paenibacillus sp. 1011MAR3C5 TaxID=1675787 RepID=UPI000E6B7FD7|nr:BadF/BadG/BcrA/BcrD ATPase family protein [Paenibacillus sp. 1011MAR3C5]RJE91353.1 ATPase [Paenibacillus sp. 1011MAR3C5]
MKYYLGVDAGGSKTYAVIANENGEIAGMGKGGNGNHQTDRRQTEISLKEAVTGALEEAGLTEDQIEFAWFGLAGADRESDFRILRPMIAGLNLPRSEISGDTMIAMRAGTENPFGIVIICGSGVNCSGTNRAGELYQCGGFGYQFGDFGGGYDLSVEVFRSVVRAYEGRETKTELTDKLINLLGYASVAELRDDYLDHDRHLPVDVARLLFQAAEEGDETAIRLLIKQGEELGLAAAATIRHLDMSGEAFDLVLAGSLLTKGDQAGIIRSAIERKVKQAAPNCTLTVLKNEPVIGAVILAMEHGGLQMTRGLMNQMMRTQINNIRNIQNIQ